MVFSVKVLYLPSEVEWTPVKMFNNALRRSLWKVSSVVSAPVCSNQRCFSLRSFLCTCGPDWCHPQCFHFLIHQGFIIKTGFILLHSQFSAKVSRLHYKMLGTMPHKPTVLRWKVNRPDTRFKVYENKGMLGLRAQTLWDTWVLSDKKEISHFT